jgi:hypothetical protein
MEKTQVKNIEGFNLRLNDYITCKSFEIVRFDEDIKEITIPESFLGIPVMEIRSLAFANKVKLENIHLPKSLIRIGFGAFESCINLSSIHLPENLATIEKCAFIRCNKLAEITVDKENPVFASYEGVLFDKTNATLLIYPPGKKGEYHIPDSTIETVDDSFDGCNELYGVNIPKNLMRIKSNSFLECERLKYFKVDENNPRFSSIDGVLFSRDLKCLHRYPQGNENKTYTVPSGVTRIFIAAFFNCKYPENIILPEGLEIIDNVAFSGCERLISLTLPSSLQYIGESAFSNCPNLETTYLSRNTKMGYKTLNDFSGQLIYYD